MTDRDAFIESAGIANGTAGLVSGIFIALLILMVSNTPGFETTGPVVTDQEKKQAVAFLADAARGGERAAADADAGEKGEGLQIDEGTRRFVRALALAIKEADRSAAAPPPRDLDFKDPEKAIVLEIQNEKQKRDIKRAKQTKKSSAAAAAAAAAASTSRSRNRSNGNSKSLGSII